MIWGDNDDYNYSGDKIKVPVKFIGKWRRERDTPMPSSAPLKSLWFNTVPKH